MTTVSLDQNVVSNLVKNGNDPYWQVLREQLVAGVRAGKLLCPIPKETIFETIPCSRDVRVKIYGLLQQLSLGLSFKQFSTIKGEETLALVRPGTPTFPFERIVWHSVEDDELATVKAKEIQDAKAVMWRRMQAFVPSAGQDKLSVKELRGEVIASRAGSLFRQVERLIAGQQLDPADDLQFGLCRFLSSRGITRPELEHLRQRILAHEWEAIPVVFFSAALGAILDHGRIRGRKYQVNDEIDICRLAIALWAADVAITERSMACVVRQFEKEWAERLNVFAANERKAIRECLETATAA
jgi:hypothetical protein